MKIRADTFLDLVPTKSNKVDFSYLIEYGNRENYQIPTCFEIYHLKQGQSFESRITNIYDPSKFWMVTKYKELEIFQKHLFRFYYMNRTSYKIPHDKITINLYCVAFVDNAYYRGVIVGFPINHGEEEQEIQVLFIDYGMLGAVGTDNIYYISERCLKVPQFAIKASLAGISPLSSSEWTSEDVLKFHSFVANKALKGIILNIDYERQILDVILNVKSENSILCVQEMLLSQKCAQYLYEKEKCNEMKMSNEYKFKYPHLFPSHEILESGKVPAAVSDAEYQGQIVPVSRYHCKNNIDFHHH